MIGAVVLAAGAGRRLGGRNKALLPAGRGTALMTVVEVARAAGVTDLLAVAGEPHLEATVAEALRLGIAVVVNPAPTRGMGSSVECGFAHAQQSFSAEAALLWPVDHFRVGADVLRCLIERADPARVVIPTFGGKGGHPPLIGRAWWPLLATRASCEGGTRAVWRSDPDRVERLEVDDSGVLRDADTAEDLD